MKCDEINEGKLIYFSAEQVVLIEQLNIN